MRFYFVRHGQSEANVLQEISNRGQRHPLTDLGREQAAALAERLRDAGIGRLYSSPLLRATQTADILAAAWGIDYAVTDALREFDCGVAEGRADQAAWDAWHWVVDEWFAGHWDARIEDGESLIDVRDRFVPFVDGLTTRYSEAPGAIACIGHGGLYLTMMPLVLANWDPTWLERTTLHNTAVIEAASRPPTGLPPLHNTATIEAEPQGRRLICVEWAGIKVG